MAFTKNNKDNSQPKEVLDLLLPYLAYLKSIDISSAAASAKELTNTKPTRAEVAENLLMAQLPVTEKNIAVIKTLLNNHSLTSEIQKKNLILRCYIKIIYWHITQIIDSKNMKHYFDLVEYSNKMIIHILEYLPTETKLFMVSLKLADLLFQNIPAVVQSKEGNAFYVDFLSYLKNLSTYIQSIKLNDEFFDILDVFFKGLSVKDFKEERVELHKILNDLELYVKATWQASIPGEIEFKFRRNFFLNTGCKKMPSKQPLESLFDSSGIQNHSIELRKLFSQALSFAFQPSELNHFLATLKAKLSLITEKIVTLENNESQLSEFHQNLLSFNEFLYDRLLTKKISISMLENPILFTQNNLHQLTKGLFFSAFNLVEKEEQSLIIQTYYLKILDITTQCLSDLQWVLPIQIFIEHPNLKEISAILFTIYQDLIQKTSACAEWLENELVSLISNLSEHSDLESTIQAVESRLDLIVFLSIQNSILYFRIISALIEIYQKKYSNDSLESHLMRVKTYLNAIDYISLTKKLT
ncbi:MAG: hypothetical protein JSS53_09680, partial [Proteobacteria bacterium]|nr:hypothetical protein [Pseudomonadota bacterium]